MSRPLLLPLLFSILPLAWAGVARGAPTGGEAPAAEKRAGSGEKAPRVVNFDDDTIQGDLTRPDGEYVESRRRVEHSNLIKLREEFRERVLRSVGEL